MSRTPSLVDPHHDGSELYVPEQPAELGDEVVVRLRVPRPTRVDHVALRYVHDGQPRLVRASRDGETSTDTWWRASFRAVNPRTRYRWLLSGGEIGYGWVTGSGIARFDLPDTEDFVVAVGAGGPSWHPSSVVYEIFPDRFGRSDRATEPPAWATPRLWDERPSRGLAAARDWFGGDLAGIEAHLDHVQSLGANVVYLTPFFPAQSTHRYDATTFGTVDPLLGGDEALVSLVRLAHERGLRVVGDLTLHHCGDGHEWFQTALRDPDAPERGFFIFDAGVRHGYETWLGVKTLPKLDHRSLELRRRLTAGPDSVVERWLRPPTALDGWRIDVANMIGRYGDVDLGLEVAHAVRRALDEARPDGLLVAEHGHDYRDDLVGDGWHGVMNYQGFLMPTWAWLRADELPRILEREFFGMPVGVPFTDGRAVVESVRRFRSGVPWPSVVNSWALLDSHDTARFSVVSGARERHLVGLGLQMTSPGVPMVWAGDEIGLGGDWGEDSRRPLPWDRPEDWDVELLAAFRRLIALRRSSRALAVGGIRYVHVDADTIVYLRESATERVLCAARRVGGSPARIAVELLGGALEPIVQEGVTGEVGLEDHEIVLPGDGPGFMAWRIG